MYLYFSTGNGQPWERALCQLYRHTFISPFFSRKADFLMKPYASNGIWNLAWHTMSVKVPPAKVAPVVARQNDPHTRQVFTLFS